VTGVPFQGKVCDRGANFQNLVCDMVSNFQNFVTVKGLGVWFLGGGSPLLDTSIECYLCKFKGVAINTIITMGRKNSILYLLHFLKLQSSSGFWTPINCIYWS